MSGEKGKKLKRESADGPSLRAHLFASSPFHLFSRRSSAGFTLLELMIVISIIIVLAVIVMPQYMRTVQQARESVLRDDLFQMRKMIDQYAADKGKLPQSVDDLVQAGYIREMPVDPMTGRAEWNPTMGSDPNSSDNSQGLTDVHSFSTDTALDGSSTYDLW